MLGTLVLKGAWSNHGGAGSGKKCSLLLKAIVGRAWLWASEGWGWAGGVEKVEH